MDRPIIFDEPLDDAMIDRARYLDEYLGWIRQDADNIAAMALDLDGWVAATRAYIAKISSNIPDPTICEEVKKLCAVEFTRRAAN